MTLNLADLFEVVADHAGSVEAVVHGDRRVTYAELEQRANRLAHVFLDLGVEPDGFVALLLPNRLEYVEGMLAAFKIRAAPVNVNYRYVDPELAALLDDCDPAVIVTTPDHADRTAVVESRAGRAGAVLVVDRAPTAPPRAPTPGHRCYEAALAAVSPRRDFPARRSDDRYVLYTGGTTGRPKGVLWRHDDLFSSALGGNELYDAPVDTAADLASRLRPGRARTLPASPFIHGTAHWLALSTLFSAGTIVIAPSDRFEPRAVWEVIDREQVTTLAIVGDAFARPLLDAFDELEEAGTSPGGSLHIIVSGGATLSDSSKCALGRRLPGVLIVDGFGASESGGHGRRVVSPGTEGIIPAGFTFDTDTFVADDSGRPVPVGGTGRLARRGRIPLGYLNDPDATAETFPVVDGERIALLSDEARLEADGRITILGRHARSINTGGEKVHAEEVERALLAEPEVRDCVVLGVPDPRLGESVVALVAFDGTPPAPDDLRRRLGARLAGFKHPRHVVVVDEIPRTGTGKPDLVAARSLACGTLRTT